MKLDDKYQAIKVLMNLPEDYAWLECYDDTVIGLSQFAKILLEHPDVIERFVDEGGCAGGFMQRFNQGNVLDMILKMEGKWSLDE